jgi:hypothetical protein
VCDVCVAVLRLAGASGWVQRGQVSTEGPTLPGHAARHQARREGSRQTAGARGREAREAWGTPAAPQDTAAAAALGRRRGEAWPTALARRDDRLAPSEAARPRLEGRAKAAAAAAATRPRPGPKRRGQAPQEVDETPADQAPRRCPAPAWPRRQRNHKGWDDGGPAHARVEEAYQRLVACTVPGEANDQQHAAPMAQWTVAPVAPAGRERPTAAAGVGPPIPGPYASA